MPLPSVRLQHRAAGASWTAVMTSFQSTQQGSGWRERNKSQDNPEQDVQEEQWQRQPVAQAGGRGAARALAKTYPRHFRMMPCKVISVYISVDPLSRHGGRIPDGSVLPRLFSLLGEGKHGQATACASLTGSCSWATRDVGLTACSAQFLSSEQGSWPSSALRPLTLCTCTHASHCWRTNSPCETSQSSACFVPTAPALLLQSHVGSAPNVMCHASVTVHRPGTYSLGALRWDLTSARLGRHCRLRSERGSVVGGLCRVQGLELGKPGL